MHENYPGVPNQLVSKRKVVFEQDIMGIAHWLIIFQETSDRSSGFQWDGEQTHLSLAVLM